ncbi:MAG: hypothetical protein PHO10_11900, partial [Gemmiger sp.]|nr:hypothetical protein [Gemmiger sp.]
MKRDQQRRSLGSRVGLEKRGEAAQKPQQNAGVPRRPAGKKAGYTANGPAATPRQPAGATAQRPAVVNPQQPGYRQGTGRPNRRQTQVEKRRQYLRRRLVGLVAVVAALGAGVALSVNLLFKVTAFRVENTDRSTPANTGIYTEQQIIDLLGV